MRKKYIIIAVIVLCMEAFGCDRQHWHKVERVIDGDTIKIETGESVRYIGIDTPETVHPRKPVQYYGKEASEYNKKQVEGKKVRLEFDVQERDHYGRLLCYVYLADGTFVNAELVKQGYAQVSTYPPNVKYQELFLSLQKEARTRNRGLWNKENKELEKESAQRKKDISKDDDQIVYITNTGSKYHREECRFLRKSKKEIKRSEAEKRGYTPCKVCNP